MRVTLFKNPIVYSCNIFLVRGNWNAISDVNTLIDVGTNDFILNEIDNISTGVGKRSVEQIILTHEHFDHAGGLKKVYEKYKPKVFAYSKIDSFATQLQDGMQLKIGDNSAQIVHTPGHSNDSICIYFPVEKTLFSGDTPLFIKTLDGTYSLDYVKALEKLIILDIETIYSGHDEPYTKNVKEILNETYNNVIKSKIIN